MAIPDSIIERMAREFGAHYFRNWEGFGERDVPHVVASMREALSGVLGLTELIEAAMALRDEPLDKAFWGDALTGSDARIINAAAAFARANRGGE